jgi:hypothetical protein
LGYVLLVMIAAAASALAQERVMIDGNTRAKEPRVVVDEMRLN